MNLRFKKSLNSLDQKLPTPRATRRKSNRSLILDLFVSFTVMVKGKVVSLKIATLPS
nr:MAG TPA: hypothetical protein [Caudoviricetes sp.]